MVAAAGSSRCSLGSLLAAPALLLCAATCRPAPVVTPPAEPVSEQAAKPEPAEPASEHTAEPGPAESAPGAPTSPATPESPAAASTSEPGAPAAAAKRESYVACGCGCCGGAEPVKKCIDRAKGDDLAKIKAEDEKARKRPQCAVMGCSRGTEYSYCD